MPRLTPLLPLLAVAVAIVQVACAARVGPRVRVPVEAGGSGGDVVLLGRTEERMREVLALLGQVEGARLHATYTEAAAIERIRALEDVRVVLIGGAIDGATRARIRALLAAERPRAVTSEPGLGYPYSDAGILADVRRGLAGATPR